MTYEFRMIRRVEFAETDMAGIMHFSNYFRFMEATEHAFFRSLDLRVHDGVSTGMRGWARVHAACDYRAPLRYEDVVEVHLLVAEKKAKSISYTALFRCIDPTDDSRGPVVATGRWTVVCVGKDEHEQLRSVTMPPDVDAALDAAPPELLQAPEAS